MVCFTLQGLLTRSKTAPYDKDVCFFCNDEARYQQPLHLVSTKSAGYSLEAAVKKLDDPKLLVKLSTAIDARDAHAIDIKYHKNCWTKHVVNILRKSSTEDHEEETSLVASKIEFLAMTESVLNSGQVVDMGQLTNAFASICCENNVKSKRVGRKSVKQLIEREIEGVEFHRPKRLNEPDLVSVKHSRDSVIQRYSESSKESMECNVKTLYDAASIIRKGILKSDRWIFDGSLDTLSHKHCPEELLCFFRWIIQGPNTIISDEGKCAEVHKRAMQLAQSTVSMCLSERQVKNKKSEVIYSTREMPQQLAVSLAIHQAIRSKEIITLLHGFGMAVEYNRLLRVESDIEKAVLARVKNEGVYLPPDTVKGRHVFFAIDNIDFAEDTPDGKRTLHGTSMAIYQRIYPNDKQPQLR